MLFDLRGPTAYMLKCLNVMLHLLTPEACWSDAYRGEFRSVENRWSRLTANKLTATRFQRHTRAAQASFLILDFHSFRRWLFDLLESYCNRSYSCCCCCCRPAANCRRSAFHFRYRSRQQHPAAAVDRCFRKCRLHRRRPSAADLVLKIMHYLRR